MVAADVGGPVVQPGDLPVRLGVAGRAVGTPGALAAQVPQLFQRRLQGAGVRDPLDHLAVIAGHGGEHPHSDVDPDAGVWLGNRGLDGALHEYPERRYQPSPLPGHRDSENPRPAFRQQAFQPAGVLVHSHGTDPWKGDVAPVRLDPDRPGSEGDAIPVTTFLRGAREPGPPARPFPGAGGLPVPVAVSRALDAVRERLFADLPPPHLPGPGVGALGVLDPVPAFPQSGQTGLLRLLAGGVVAVQVGFQGADRPVTGMSARPELPPQARRLFR